MDNFEYVDIDKIQLKKGEGDEKPDEKVLDIPEKYYGSDSPCFNV